MQDPTTFDTRQRTAIVALLLRQADDTPLAQDRWMPLQAAHIVGQARLRLHARIHVRMLCLAWRQRNVAECAGQMLRLALLPLGHATGRLPPGNTGRSDVGAFDAVALSPAMAGLIAQARQQAGTQAPRFGPGR